MNLKLKLLSSILFVLMLAFSGLWLHEHNLATSRAHAIQTLEHDNIDLANKLEGQSRANEALRRQLEEVRNGQLAQLATLEVETLPPVRIELPDMEDDEGEMEETVATMARPEPQELTPEQVEEREARRAAWEERRAAWEERRQDNRERIVNETQYRREFFDQISLEGLAPEYRQSHERLMTAMDEVEVLVTSLNDPDLSRDEQREIRRTLGGMAREVQGLMNTQREILLNDYAQALGYTGEDARGFIDYIETVNQMTSMGGFIRGGGGGGPPRTPPGRGNDD